MSYINWKLKEYSIQCENNFVRSINAQIIIAHQSLPKFHNFLQAANKNNKPWTGYWAIPFLNHTGVLTNFSRGVWALIFQGGFVSFSDFPRGFLKVSRGFFLRKLSSIVVFPGFPAPFSQNFTFQRGFPQNFQGVVCYSKFPKRVSEKVHQYPCIIFFGIAQSIRSIIIERDQ